MIYTAKSRVGLAADGKTLVSADSEESKSLFAAEGGLVHEKYVNGKVNADKFFSRGNAAQPYRAKARVGLAKDGKTLVPADTEEAASLFAAEGAMKTEAEVEGLANVGKFFERDSDKEPKKAETKTHNAPAAVARVVAPAAPVKAPAAKIGKIKRK